MRQTLKRHQVIVFTGIMIALFVGAGSLFLHNMGDITARSQWKTDFSKTSVPLHDIVDLGGRDSFQPIDHPQWATLQEVSWLGEKSPVIVLIEADSARAYPIVVLMKHGIVNDMLGDLPIAVTYCTLCNSPMIFVRQVSDKILRFGVTGTVRNSGFIMWDDATESWWQQFTGQAIVGAYAGTQLTVLSSQVVGYHTFKARYPTGKVLIGNMLGSPMSYGRNPYIGYDSNPQPFLYKDSVDPRLFATERVLGCVVNGQAIAYPFTTLGEAMVVNDTVNNMPVVAFWQSGANSVHDQANVDQSRDVGMASLFMRVVNGEELTFRYEEGVFKDDQTNSTWNIFGEATQGALRGALLPRMNALMSFWFAWAANYPETVIFMP